MSETEPREFTERWRMRIFAAQTDLIDAYGGSRRVVEKFSISKSQVGRWYGGVDRDTMPTPIVMALEGYVGRPIVTGIMVEFLGYEVDGSVSQSSAQSCLSSLNADLVELAGNMMVETVRAKADGVITPSESQQLRKLSRQIAKVHAKIDGRLAGAEAREASELHGVSK
ncbi:hypothetical protein ACFQ3K_03520 [Brucella gallinifaecis]|uniref:Uncharacterized protein n=1 Tax=Brucella gallinifaecis TaxID=215590 RepID=A0A502BNE8_9HYPH|nr:hypothetical protein [Brucella gallinifaecis]TPF75171.1 hypothetical protein FHY56_10655 [Brucella gallinifaecis]